MVCCCGLRIIVWNGAITSGCSLSNHNSFGCSPLWWVLYLESTLLLQLPLVCDEANWGKFYYPSSLNLPCYNPYAKGICRGGFGTTLGVFVYGFGEGQLWVLVLRIWRRWITWSFWGIGRLLLRACKEQISPTSIVVIVKARGWVLRKKAKRHLFAPYIFC